MKVSLIDFTGAGARDPARYAAERLILAKRTRLEVSRKALDEIESLSVEEIEGELKYISGTIPASWEFAHYSFLLEGVTRAFTHQLVRTRTASFAQQTMRVTDMGDFDYLIPPSIEADETALLDYENTMKDINCGYHLITQRGIKTEDARGVLPTNILTNILMSVNLRTASEMIVKRSSPRVQGEYRQAIDEMARCMLEVHPWVADFIAFDEVQAVKDLEKFLRDDLKLPEEKLVKGWKLIDKIRGQK